MAALRPVQTVSVCRIPRTPSTLAEMFPPARCAATKHLTARHQKSGAHHGRFGRKPVTETQTMAPEPVWHAPATRRGIERGGALAYI